MRHFDLVGQMELADHLPQQNVLIGFAAARSAGISLSIAPFVQARQTLFAQVLIQSVYMVLVLVQEFLRLLDFGALPISILALAG